MNETNIISVVFESHFEENNSNISNNTTQIIVGSSQTSQKDIDPLKYDISISKTQS